MTGYIDRSELIKSLEAECKRKCDSKSQVIWSYYDVLTIICSLKPIETDDAHLYDDETYYPLG